MILSELFLASAGIILFFIPGILLSFILFRKADIVERCAYSLALSAGFSGVVATTLYYLRFLNQLAFFFIFVCSVLVFLLIIFKRSATKEIKTTYDGSILFIILFSLFGTLWRYLFINSIKNFSDPYAYSFKFVGKEVPNLGFYTGMVKDKSGYIGEIATSRMLEYLHINFSAVGIFLAVFLSLGFIFLLFKEYRLDKRLAFLGVAVMSIGPVELFYANTSIYGHSLSYVILLPLFLLFKSKNKNIFWIVLFLTIIAVTTYYTASIIIILCSFGFLLAILIKNFITAKNVKRAFINAVKDKIFLSFLIVLIIVFLYLSVFSEMFDYSFGKIKDSTDSKISIERLKTITSAPADVSTLYQDPAFLKLSTIRWQMLFFFLCGLTFIFYLVKLIIKKERWQEEQIDLALCLIPVALISYGFFYVNLPARIFNYFAFFGLMNLRLPKKYFVLISILCFVFILVSGFYIAKDKRIFFEISNEEILGAKEISRSFRGKIFSDQVFINQLVLNNYYNVTGADDKDQLVKNLFYQKDKSVFLSSMDFLKKSGVSYVAISDGMKEKYILMVNYPQKPILNFNLYEENLEKVYDNGGVKVYSTDTKNLKNKNNETKDSSIP